MKYFSWKSIVQLSTFVYNNFMSQLLNCLLSLPHWPPRKHTPVFHLFIRCILSRVVNRRRSEGPQPHRHSESTGNCFLWSAVRSPHVPLCSLWLQQAPCSGKQVFTSSSGSPSITKASRGGDSSRNWGGKLLTGFRSASFLMARGSIAHGGVPP